MVCDIGSHSTKIGYAGDDHPSAIYSSTVAVERSYNSTTRSNFTTVPRRDFVTRCCSGSDDDGAYQVANPIDPVTGWLFSSPSSNFNEGGNSNSVDAWESHELVSHYLRHAFEHALGLDNSSGDEQACHHPLLLLDKPHTPPALRQRLLELLFETHNLPAVFLLKDAVASCYAVGRTTGTVVDAGHSATMVTPVYEGFVETRGILRNIGCGASNVDLRILDMMDSVVKTQGGRKRRDRIKRINQRKWEERQTAGEGRIISSPSKTDQATKVSTGGVKRDASGHFIKEKVSPPDHPVPDYLMPLYQVRRAPTYTTRTGHFHDWSRLALAREIKEMGLGVAVGPMGYVCSMGTSVSTPTISEDLTVHSSLINPASANSVFLTSSRLPYILPDGTHVEISTLSRCDIVELYFANDEYNLNYLDDKFDEAVRILDQHNEDIEEYLTKEDDKHELQGGEKGIGATGRKGKLSSEVMDSYSNTSYLGLGKSRPVGKSRKYYSPETVSRKLYSACLPYIRTTPPNINNHGEGGDGGGSGGLPSLNLSVNDNYFHYLTSAPPAQMVCDSAFRCDRDQQASLLGNVILCGGGACITGAAGVGSAGQSGGAVVPGTDGAVAGVMASMLGDENAFPDRLREEIEAIIHRHTPGWRVKVTSPNVSERAICSWLGGSILGSLGTFQDMWISRKDYEEFGAAIVNRKCP